MSRKLTSGNLVVSGDRGTFEAGVTGFTTDPFFTLSQSDVQANAGTYSALFECGIGTAGTVFNNFTFAENLVVGQDIYITAKIRKNANGFILGSHEILLETQAGETVNSQTILTGSQISSSEFVTLELDVTTTLAVFRGLLKLTIRQPGGGDATINQASSGLYVDSIQAYTYEEVNYTTLLAHQFDSVNFDKKYRWELQQLNYDGSETQITAGPSPITYANSIENEFEEAVIIAASCTGSIMAPAYDTYSIMQASDREYLGILSQWNGSEYVELWRGYSIPANYQQEYSSRNAAINLTFSDLLGDLKNIDFATNDSVASEELFNDTLTTELEVVGYCLRQLDVFGIDTINVAINYQELGHTGVNQALAETYIDPTIFYEFDVINTAITVTNTKRLNEVITAILMKYTAKLVHWQGAYYITDFYNQSQETPSYAQFDLFGVSRNNTITLTGNIINHVSAPLANGFRFEGQQNIVGTSSFKKIQLNLEGIIEENGMVSDMRKKDAVLDGDGKFLGYGSDTSSSTYYSRIFGQTYSFVGSTLTPDIYVTKEGDNNRNNRLFEGTGSTSISGLTDTWLTIRDSTSGSTYSKGLEILGSTQLGNFAGDEGDVLRLEIDLESIGFSSNSGNALDPTVRPPYFQLPYKIKIGSYYYDASTQSWTTSDTLNNRFIEGTEEDVEISAVLDQAFTSSALSVEIFGIKGQIYNISSIDQTSMVNSLKAVSTTSLENGSRIVTRYQDTAFSGAITFYRYHFYELLAEYSVQGSSPEKVIPDDDNQKAWQLVTTIDVTNPITTTTIGDIRLFYWPQGEKIDGKVELTRDGETNNVAIYETSLELFDPPAVNNAKTLYKSITYNNADGTTTSAWTDTNNGTTTIQQHRLIELTKLLKQSRYKINGTLITDQDLSPLKQFKIGADGNRLMYPKNEVLDFKNNRVEAEFTEIASDNVQIQVGAHATASHSAGHN